MVSVRVSLKLEREQEHFPSRKNGGRRDSFAPELNEKEVIELSEDLSNILGRFNKTIIPPGPDNREYEYS